MENNRYISLTYDLYASRNGEQKLVEQATEQQPMTFISGVGQALASFEEQVRDIAEGSDFEFVLPPDPSFGIYHEENIILIPKSTFIVDGHLDEQVKPGATVPLRDNTGRQFLAQVVEIDNDNVRMDFNHPLASSELHFRGHVLENRPATDDEVREASKPHQCHHHCGKGHCHGNGKGHCHDEEGHDCHCEGGCSCHDDEA